MKPKEKAEELVYSLREYADLRDYDKKAYSPALEKERAKKCALIALEQVMEALEMVDCDRDSEEYKWWIKVRKEVEKL